MYHVDLIVQNGELKIPSIFMFENSLELRKFLNYARDMSCVIVFDNENLIVDHTSDYYRFKLYAYEQMLDNRDIGNAYLRYLGSTDKMNWESFYEHKKNHKKEEQNRKIQEAIIEHRRKMETDEEYRKECEKFQSMIMDFGDDEE